MRIDRSVLIIRTRRLADLLSNLFTAAMALCVFVITVLVFGNVVMRYGFGSGLNISVEASRLAFVWVTFGGAVLAFRAREHLAINMLIERFPVKVQKWIHILRQLLILWVVWLALEGSWTQTLINLGIFTPISGLPVAVFSGAVLFCALAIGIMTILDLFVALSTPAVDDNAEVFRTTRENLEDA